MDKQTTSFFFILPRAFKCDTYTATSFQFWVLNDICFTNSKLAKIGYVNEDSCSLCGNAVETVTHLFIDCRNVNIFWENFEVYVGKFLNENIKLNEKNIIVGIQENI